MKEYKKKRTQFLLEAGCWPLEAIFAKRTQFPRFSANFRGHQNMYTCIPAYLHTCFAKTNPIPFGCPLSAVCCKLFFTKRTHFGSSTGESGIVMSCIFSWNFDVRGCTMWT